MNLPLRLWAECAFAAVALAVCLYAIVMALLLLGPA